MATESEILAARRERARALRERGTDLFPARVPASLEPISRVRERWAAADAETRERETPRVRVAGRLVGIRSFGKAAFAVVQGAARSWLGCLVLVGFTWALFYHLCNGIRHLFWDVGMGFELETARLSGYGVVVASFLLTALAWLAGLLGSGGAS